MKIPLYAQIVDLHQSSIREFGGENGILNMDGLRDFIDNIDQAIYFGKKSINTTAAYIFVRLIQSHYFVDGNKRVGLGTLLSFLHINKCKWTQTMDLYELTMKVASASHDVLPEIEELFEKIIDCA